MLKTTRRTDLVVRYGGEEFVVLLPDTEAEGAARLAERCRGAIEAADWVGRSVTISVGVATFLPNVWSGDDLLEAADRALYEAKRCGRNRVSGPLEVQV